jgi:predicted dehydrogenase
MAPTPVRIGIVGCGNVMEYAYSPQIQRLRARGMALEVTRACDIVAARRHVVQQLFGDLPFSTDYRSVVEAPDVDMVIVLTSMPEHGPVARAALEAGKHVLVEKPMAITLEEAAELVALARRGPALLLPAPHVMLSPTYQAIWRHIHRGDIGQVTQARTIYGHSGPDWGPWFYRAGGGPLFDLGVYNVVSLTGWLGPARRVTALTGVAIPEREIEGQKVAVEGEDNAIVLLDFGNAAFASVATGFTIQRYRGATIEIYGTEGTIRMLGDDWDPNGYELWQNKLGTWQLVEETYPDWPWTDGVRHLVECIQQGTHPLTTPEHGYHVLEIMLKAKAAGRDGQAYTIESSFTPPSFLEEDERDIYLNLHDRTNR